MKNAFILGASLLCLSTGAFAASIDLTTGTLNGNASVSGTDVELTEAIQSQRGSVFTSTASSISSTTTFSANFTYSISTPSGGGADGLAFVIQNSSAGSGALGSAGGGLGYGGIDQSVTVEFDNWNNGGIDDNLENHVGINVDGNLDSIVTADPVFDLDNVSMATAWVDYDGTTLSVATSTDGIRPMVDLLSTNIDLSSIVGSLAFFGFTAATGGEIAVHTIHDFNLEFGSTVTPIPLPAGLPLLGGGLLLMGWLGRKQRSLAS